MEMYRHVMEVLREADENMLCVLSNRRPDTRILLAHINAAYHQFQARLSTLVHCTRSEHYRADIEVAQYELDF